MLEQLEAGEDQASGRQLALARTISRWPEAHVVPRPDAARGAPEPSRIRLPKRVDDQQAGWHQARPTSKFRDRHQQTAGPDRGE